MNRLVFILFVVCALPARAQDIPATSLFFSPQQTRAAEALAERSLPPGSADINLGAVVYYGKDDWVLWLQGERWVPQTRHDGLRVVDVSPARVRIAWRDDTGAERDITLRPNQTYQIATGEITE